MVMQGIVHIALFRALPSPSSTAFPSAERHFRSVFAEKPGDGDGG